LPYAYSADDRWYLQFHSAASENRPDRHEVIDQLEAARQLARFESGLEIQDLSTQKKARQLVLDAGEEAMSSGASASASAGPN